MTLCWALSTPSRKRASPSSFHPSSGYTSQNKRCVFTWNTERFKDPSADFHAMNEKHAQNVPNVKPGILLCHPRFDEFEQDGVFVKDSKNPETYGVGKWWGRRRRILGLHQA